MINPRFTGFVVALFGGLLAIIMVILVLARLVG